MGGRKDRFCDHFHLPLQSGHDRILSLMRRSYNCSEYESTLTLIRRYFPHANLTADVIPGFPGESDLEFAATVEFIRQSGLNGLHVFPYSKRPNTAAARMPGHIEASIVKSRAAELRKLAAELQGAYARSFLNKNLTVLWEHQYDEAGRLKGKSKNYLNIVSKPSEQIQPGMISEVTLKGFTNQFDLLAIPSLTY
ncbi:MAG: radical SAM protein [Bdellovibrionota bacterium]